MCVTGVNTGIDTRPSVFASHRQQYWPHATSAMDATGLTYIYEAVRSTGLPNILGARIPIPTDLKLENWDRYAPCMGQYANVVDFVRYGFPLGYLGPVSDTVDTPNHPSATSFPAQIEAFITKEKEIGGLVGPFKDPPFQDWCHIAPLMTRPKRDTEDRQVISDLTFPDESSVNAYIIKNSVFGIEQEHSLPNIDGFVEALREMGPGSFMATLDIAHAYKNFRSDPLDWPLQCIKWDDRHYCEVAMPFGARASSYHMQRVALAIVSILEAHDISTNVP